MAKTRLNFSLDPETIARLRLYAAEQHRSMSQCVTDFIWDCKLEGERRKDENTRNIKKE